MPYKFEYDKENKIDLAKTKNDNRIKLTDEQRKNIITEYNTTLISQRALARKYGVDRKTIYNILHPEKYQEQLEQCKINKHSKQYYNKEKHGEYMKKYRQHKKNVYDKINKNGVEQ